MDLRQLKYFAAVIDEGSVRAAANALHVSQPALSVAIKNLEAELELPLLARVGRGVEPTADGHRFYRHARSILAQSQRAVADMKSRSGLEVASITIASPALNANHVIAKPLAQFLSQHPGVKLSLRQVSGHEVSSALHLGEIDIGFTTQPLGEEIAQTALFEEHAVACVPRGHPLANRETVDWSTLIDLPLATLPDNYLMYDKLMRESRKHRKSPNILLETDVMTLLLSTVRAGTAVGLMINSAVPDDLVAVRLDGPEQTPFTIYACWRADMPLSHASEKLIEFLREC